jgi:hypothetical protein
LPLASSKSRKCEKEAVNHSSMSAQKGVKKIKRRKGFSADPEKMNRQKLNWLFDHQKA